MENTRTQKALIFRNFLEPLFNSQFNMFKKQELSIISLGHCLLTT